MLRRASLIMMVAAATVTLVTFGAYVVTRPTELTVAVGPPGSEDVRLMTAVAQILRRDRTSLRLKVVPVDDPAAAAAALDADKVDLAVIRSDLRAPATAQSVAILHRNVATVLAPGGSKIGSVSDLQGKTVGLVRGTPLNDKMLDTILAQYEVPRNEVARIGLGPDDVFSAVGNRRVDAILAVGPITGSLMTTVVSAVAAVGNQPPVFVPVAEADAIAQRSTAYDSTTIVRGAFGGTPPKPGDAVPTIAAVYRLAAQAKLSDTTVAEFTRHLFEMRADLAAAVPAAERIEAPATEKGSGAVVHPGAAAYLDSEERSFLDRYGDWFYLIAMLFGFVASAAAALAGRWRTRSNEQAERLEMLLRIMRDARGADSLATLDALEREADDVFAQTLTTASHQEIDTGRLAAFSLALDQVRHAIGDRRRMLGGVEAVVATVPGAPPSPGAAPLANVTPLRAAGE